MYYTENVVHSHGALQWVSLSNTNLKSEEFLSRLLVINTSKRTIKLVSPSTKGLIHGSHMKRKGINKNRHYIYKKQTNYNKL